MSKVLTVSTIAILASASMAASAGIRYVAADDSMESAVCVSSAIDRPMAFDQKLEKARYSYRLVANKLRCNGESITSFSASAGNFKTAAVLHRYWREKGTVEVKEASTALPAAGVDLVILVKGE